MLMMERMCGGREKGDTEAKLERRSYLRSVVEVLLMRTVSKIAEKGFVLL